MTNPRVDPLVGRTIAQYEIVARRGGGGMGVVYEARDTKLGRRVALKFLPPQWSHDEPAKQRFVREAQAASATDHPNICTIHDVGTSDDGQLFIVMAYYEGETLKARLARGPLPLQEALDIATQVADGLARAHANGVVHRDIKPGNLILTEDGVRIVDFGLATFADALQLTIPGSTLGTAAYMSPEQARGEPADARADVWAVGIILYEMLAGHVPFQGAYAEAIAYAIRNDAPAPLRATRPEVPEEVEQLIFRALHKDPAIRFQNGRELARALRQARGFTVPVELRTQALDVGSRAPGDRPGARRGRLGTALAAAVLLPVLFGGWWLFRPVARIPVVVAPAVNQTGDGELDEYRLALAYVITSALAESPEIRAVHYGRLAEILRPLALDGIDVSSRESLQAIGARSGARHVLVPTLINRNGLWLARLELRTLGAATSTVVFETGERTAALSKPTAFDLAAALAGGIADHFESRRGRVLAAVGGALGLGSAESLPPVRTLDAARSMEEGLTAYEELEYDTARRAFAAAARQDRESPVALAWLSRVELLMRQGDAAAATARRALALLGDRTSPVDELFTRAVAAEALEDFDAAEDFYAELADRHPDDAQWLMELAAFEDRRTRNAEAVTAYMRALEVDEGLERPHVELCRLYGQNRLNEPVRAREEGRLALERYERLGSAVGQAQALFCLVDILRVGSEAERAEARRHAESALRLLQQPGYRYNLPRAYNYLALIAGYEGNMPEAIRLWEQSLASAEASGNMVLQPRVLQNLGVAHEAQGQRAQAVTYNRRSYELNERLGDQHEAARIRANTGAILIEYGDLEAGLRDVQSALAVFRQLEDRFFEAFSHQLVAAYHRHAGRYAQAEEELSVALNVARSRDLDERVASIRVDQARLLADRGEYGKALTTLRDVLASGPGRETPRARVMLGRLFVRLGAFDRAEAELQAVLAESGRRGDIVPALRLGLGELALERDRLDDARIQFSESAALLTGDLPDPASLQSAALVDVLDVLAAGESGGSRGIQACLSHAQATGRTALERRCLLLRAESHVHAGQGAAALKVLSAFDGNPGGELEVEMQAQVHHWRAAALRQQRDAGAAAEEERRARAILRRVQEELPAEYRGPFAGRRGVRLVASGLEGAEPPAEGPA